MQSIKKNFVWAIWLIGSIFYAYQYILRVMPSILMNDIVQQFHIDTATFGQFSGVYYIGYALMHVPLGIMLDRFGPKKVMPLCILITSIGLLPIIFSNFWIYPIIGRLLIGVGSSAAILGLFKIIRTVFAEQQFSRMLSFSVSIGLLGAIYGGGPVNLMCNAWGYKIVVALFAIVGVLLSITTYLILPNTSSQTNSVFADIKAVLSNKRVFMLCCLGGLMIGPLEGFADAWGSEFLKQVYNLDANIAASLPSVIFIGMCCGAPILNIINERTKSPLLTILGSGIVMAGAFMMLLAGDLNVSFLSALFFVIGICCAYQITTIYKATTYVDDQVVGLTTAVANMIMIMFGYMFHSIIGWVVEIACGVNSTEAFIYGITVIPVTLTIAVIGITIMYARERILIPKVGASLAV